MKAVCREPSCEDKDPCARDDTLDELADARLRQRVRVQKAVGSSLRTVCTSPPSLGSVPAAPSAGGGSRAGPRLASRPGTLHGIRGADAGGRFTLWPTSGSQGHRAGGLYSALSANTACCSAAGRLQRTLPCPTQPRGRQAKPAPPATPGTFPPHVPQLPNSKPTALALHAGRKTRMPPRGGRGGQLHNLCFLATEAHRHRSRSLL